MIYSVSLSTIGVSFSDGIYGNQVGNEKIERTPLSLRIGSTSSTGGESFLISSFVIVRYLRFEFPSVFLFCCATRNASLKAWLVDPEAGFDKQAIHETDLTVVETLEANPSR